MKFEPLALQAERHILLIRQQRVMLDYDLASLYEIETRVLIQVNVAILRAFVRLRELLLSNADLARKPAELERKYDAQFKVVFDAIRQLMAPEPAKPKPEIGFHVREEAVPCRTRRPARAW